MRHIPLGIFAIVAIVGIATLMLSVSLFDEPSFFAVSYLPATYAQPGSNTVIVRLDIGEYIAHDVTALTESQLAGLQHGTVHGRDLSSDYVQTLRFGETSVFSGGHLIFGRDERDRVSDFLQFDDGDAVFKYQVEFSPGLRSKVDNGKLADIEDEDMSLMGDTYTIVDTAVNTATKRISLRFFGGFGSIEFEDSNYGDDVYSNGVKVNGQNIDARIKIKAIETGGKLTIFSIQYILNANGAQGGHVQVLPLHCVREFLQYPQGMLSPNFDLCYKGLGAAAVGVTPQGVSGNEVRVRPSGSDEYSILAANSHGQLYKIPLAQLPGMYGNRGRNFVFVEAPAIGAPNIMLDDYLLVNSKNDVQGVSHVLRYDHIDSSSGVVYFEDLGGGQETASFDPGTGEGDLLVSEGTYHFKVGAGDALAMDQTNDGSINGGEARFVLPGGSRIDFGPGFVVKIITPSKLFDEPMGDETTQFNILFGGHIDLNVPSPQATVPGYTFDLHSESGSVEQGLTKYGILFTWDEESSSDNLKLTVPGAYAQSTKGGAAGEVYVSLERQKLIKQTQVPAPPAKCGDRLITKPEYCDPPGSQCADQFKRTGTCSADCLACEFKAAAECGNRLLEKEEECEAAADCPAGFGCQGCKCMPLPKPAQVCGNNLIESREQCEKNVDCGADMVCSLCNCVAAPPVVQSPAPVQKPNIIARFFAWLARLFGA